MQESGQNVEKKGSFIWTIDLAGALLNWKIAEQDTWRLGFYSPEPQQCGKREWSMFGMPCAPGINDEPTKEITRLLKKGAGTTISGLKPPRKVQKWVGWEFNTEKTFGQNPSGEIREGTGKVCNNLTRKRRTENV